MNLHGTTFRRKQNSRKTTAPSLKYRMPLVVACFTILLAPAFSADILLGMSLDAAGRKYYNQTSPYGPKLRESLTIPGPGLIRIISTYSNYLGIQGVESGITTQNVPGATTAHAWPGRDVSWRSLPDPLVKGQPYAYVSVRRVESRVENVIVTVGPRYESSPYLPEGYQYAGRTTLRVEYIPGSATSWPGGTLAGIDLTFAGSGTVSPPSGSGKDATESGGVQGRLAALIEGTWTGTLRKHTDCSYSATATIIFKTDSSGITRATVDEFPTPLTGRISGNTFTFEYGLSNGKPAANGSFIFNSGGSGFTGTFSDTSGHKGTWSGTRTAQADELDASRLAGRWDYVYDATWDGIMKPAEPPYPVDIAPAGGSRFTARYGTGLFGSYSGELRRDSAGRVIVVMKYSDPPRNYTAEFEGVLVSPDTMEGRYTDSRGGKYEFRWTKK